MRYTHASTSGVAKVVKKIHLGEEKSDVSFWQSQPYQIRIDALEQIRREYNQWKYHAQPGLQRVVNVIKR